MTFIEQKRLFWLFILFSFVLQVTLEDDPTTIEDEETEDTTEPSIEEMCPCNLTSGSMNSSLHRAAKEMQESIKNKTTWLQRAHHRVTHSRDAFMASCAVTGLIVAIVGGVLSSQMWKDKAHLAVQQRQPVHFDHYSKKTEILVKDMLRDRARKFAALFGRKKKTKKVNKASLQMSTFLERDLSVVDEGNEDDIDTGLHRHILLSSSTATSSDSSDFEWPDEDQSAYELNRSSGEWIGLKSRGQLRQSQTFMPSSPEDAAPVHRHNPLKSFFTSKSTSKLKSAVNYDGSDVHLLAESSTSDEEI